MISLDIHEVKDGCALDNGIFYNTDKLITYKHYKYKLLTSDIIPNRWDLVHDAYKENIINDMSQMLHSTVIEHQKLPSYDILIFENGVVGKLFITKQNHITGVILHHPEMTDDFHLNYKRYDSNKEE